MLLFHLASITRCYSMWYLHQGLLETGKMSLAHGSKREFYKETGLR